MTINQVIRILDPATTAEELATIEYYGGLHGREKMVAACDEACRVAWHHAEISGGAQEY